VTLYASVTRQEAGGSLPPGQAQIAAQRWRRRQHDPKSTKGTIVADPTPEPRPLIVRLAEYASVLRSTSEQMIETAEAVEAKYGKKAANTEGIRDGARLYGLFCNDLSRLIGGEELETFIIEGEV